MPGIACCCAACHTTSVGAILTCGCAGQQSRPAARAHNQVRHEQADGTRGQSEAGALVPGSLWLLPHQCLSTSPASRAVTQHQLQCTDFVSAGEPRLNAC